MFGSRLTAFGKSAVVLLVMTGFAAGQDTADFYKKNCANCHTIGGGRLTGPDLKDVSQRKDRDWLIRFMMDPQAVIDSGDDYAQKILRESRNVPMPKLPGMTRERSEYLLDLIDAESKLEASQFKGIQVSNEPFTDDDRVRGREIFLGRVALEKGGTACIACHDMHDTRALGGGRLGPDLTNVYERLKDRKTLSAWLSAPATETMQPVFSKHPLTSEEIHSLVAYFESSAGQTPADPTTSRVALLLIGMLVAAGMVFAMDAIWKRRFHSVRQPLVDSSPVRGHS